MQMWEGDGWETKEDDYRQDGDAPGKDEYVIIFSLLHSADPSIIGFQVVEINAETEEWECLVFYPGNEEGVMKGKGTMITSMVGGAKYDIVSRREAIRQLEMDPEYPLNSFLEPREP